MSTLKTNTIKNTDDVEMYLAKAWVNFNGTGTVAIRAAGNVSSITDNGTGDYTVNFATALTDTNYAVATSSKQNEANGVSDSYYLISGYHVQSSYSASSYRVVSLRQRYDVVSPQIADNESVQLAIFR